MEFNDKEVYDTLENMNELALDNCSFGVVRMSIKGEIKAYNRYESEVARITS